MKPVLLVLAASCFMGMIFSCNFSQTGSKVPEKVLDREPPKEEVQEEEASQEEEEQKDSRSERQRLKIDKENIIESLLSDRYSGTKTYDSYGGPLCREYNDCMDICDEFGSLRSRCYKQPESLVFDLKDGLYNLLHISSVDNVGVSPGLLLGILQIDDGLILDLIEDHMSEGSIKSFLAWIAINEDIASVLDKEDSRGNIIETAFEKLGELQKSDDEFKTGFNTGLIGIDDTFSFLAADEGNEEAFKIGHELVERACRDKDCKKTIYCARQKQARVRNLSLVNLHTCRTPENTRRSFRNRSCYVHGGDVWSYIYELVQDNEIRDKDFDEDEDVLGVEKCNSFCGSSSKCNVI